MEDTNTTYSPTRFPLDKYSINNEKANSSLVHKNSINNILISTPIILSQENNIFRSKIIFDLDHSFFFDHPLEHLPGILLLEAARQFGTAISQLFFNAPSDSQFILHDLKSNFFAGADTKDDVYIDVSIINFKMKKNTLRKLSGIGYVHQRNQTIAEISSSWSIIPKTLLEHLKKFH